METILALSNTACHSSFKLRRVYHSGKATKKTYLKKCPPENYQNNGEDKHWKILVDRNNT